MHNYICWWFFYAINKHCLLYGIGYSFSIYIVITLTSSNYWLTFILLLMQQNSRSVSACLMVIVMEW